MPLPKGYDYVIPSCLRDFAGYDTSVAIGTDFPENMIGIEYSSSRRGFTIEGGNF